MNENTTDWSSTIEQLLPLIAHLRKHIANGSIAAADLLEAAHRILVAPAHPGGVGIRLTNADCLRVMALRLKPL